MTRRSHVGQSAERSRFASDQKANVAAGMTLRQYTHGTPHWLSSACASTVTLRKSMSLLPMLWIEAVTVRRPWGCRTRGGEKHKGRMNQAR